MADHKFDVVIVGGGFYGCCVALYMREFFNHVLVIEKETDILTRASYANQARVHNGYHYPRSFITALRSRVNFPRFIEDFSPAVHNSFTKIYAVARNGSKVNAHQFKKFCQKIGAEVKAADKKIAQLFDPYLIEEVFSVKEYAFDATILRGMLRDKMNAKGITLWTDCEAKKVGQNQDSSLFVELTNGEIVHSVLVFNCTYSQINSLLEDSSLPRLPLKHEITEMALVDLPEPLKGIGVTVMDGPFFSIMPFPARNLHTLSHVRYTPHYSWSDMTDFKNGHEFLRTHPRQSNYNYMLRDAARYIPSVKNAKYVDSLFEVKTVLMQNEVDDGRPILFRKDYGFKNFSVIMGGKIDNIYDILEAFKQSGNFR